MGAGLRPGAKATVKPPDPKAGAPVLDSTHTRLGAAIHGLFTPPPPPPRRLLVKSYARKVRVYALLLVGQVRLHQGLKPRLVLCRHQVDGYLRKSHHSYPAPSCA